MAYLAVQLAQSTPEDIVNYIETGGIIAVLVGGLFLLLVGLHREWWVPGRYYRERMAEKDKIVADLTEDRDRWRETTGTGTRLANQSTELLGESVKHSMEVARAAAIAAEIIARDKAVSPPPDQRQ